MKTLIRHAHLISPDLEIKNGAMLLENGKIAAIFHPSDELPQADEMIDAAGQMVMPGFIDIHCHGANGNDVCDNTLEAIRQIAEVKLKEGVTTWLPTTLTQPQASLEEICGKCSEYMANQEFCRTPGMHIEGPFINAKNAGAQNPEFVRLPNLDEFNRLHEISPALVISLAPDMEGAVDFIRDVSAKGVTCSAAHTSSTAAQIWDAKAAGLTHLTHFGNAMTPLHHREIGCVGAGLMDDSLKLELICDKIHLAPDMLKLIFQLVPIERLLMITDSMAASWVGNGEVMLGGLEVVVKDDVARLKEGGALAGSALLFNIGVKNIAELTNLPLSEIVKATSWNQAQSVGLKAFGKLEKGFHADVVILDSQFGVLRTIVGGVTKFKI